MSTRRTARLAVLCACLLAAAACSSPEPTTAPPGSEDCLSISRAKTVDELNQQIQTSAALPYFRGADVGASVRLSDGRSVWVFGDTIRDSGATGGRIVRNSMLLFSAECMQPVIPAGGGAIIPDRDDGVGYWPMSISVVPRDGYDLVGVMAQRVSGSGNAWDFDVLGPALAIFRVPLGGQPRLLTVSEYGEDNPSHENPAWGAAAQIGLDGFTYLYGTSKPDDGSTFGYAVRVARVPTNEVLTKSAWTYWDGLEWQGDESKAATVIGAVGGVSQTFSALFKNGKVYLISKRDDALGQDLVAWVGTSPEGPFIASDPLAHIPSDPEKKLWVYMPIAHPELFPSNDSVVVSVSQNSDDLQRVLENPTLYRPLFMQVTLP